MVFWYADWCAGCIAIDRKMLTDAEASEVLQTYSLIVVDVTKGTIDQRHALEMNGLFHPPAISFTTSMGWRRQPRIFLVRHLHGVDRRGRLDRERRPLTRCAHISANEPFSVWDP